MFVIYIACIYNFGVITFLLTIYVAILRVCFNLRNYTAYYDTRNI